MTKRKLARITKLSLFPAFVLVVAWMIEPVVFWAVAGAMVLAALAALFVDEAVRR